MLTIRRATSSDVGAMHAIQMRAFAEEGCICGTRDIPPLQERPESIAEHVETQLALVAIEGSTALGCVRGVRDSDGWMVRALAVEPTMHGRGIGSALLRALETELPQAKRIHLKTNTLVPGNVSFYERHGYRVYEYTEPVPGIRLALMAKSASGDA